MDDNAEKGTWKSFKGLIQKSFMNEANIHRVINMYQLSLIITTDI